MIGWERYRLVLYHEFVDTEGKRHRIDDPIVVEEIYDNNIPSGVVINQMIERLTHFVLDKKGEE